MYKYVMWDHNQEKNIFFTLPWRIFSAIIIMPDREIRVRLTRDFNYDEQAYEAVGCVKQF